MGHNSRRYADASVAKSTAVMRKNVISPMKIAPSRAHGRDGVSRQRLVAHGTDEESGQIEEPGNVPHSPREWETGYRERNVRGPSLTGICRPAPQVLDAGREASHEAYDPGNGADDDTDGISRMPFCVCSPNANSLGVMCEMPMNRK